MELEPRPLSSMFWLRLWLPDDEAVVTVVSTCSSLGLPALDPVRDLITGLELEHSAGWQLVVAIPGRLVHEAMLERKVLSGKYPEIELDI